MPKNDKFQNRIAQCHNEFLTKELRNKGIYEKVDSGAIEMLSALYADFRDKDIPLKDKRDSIKLYIALIKQYGGTPASRQQLNLKPSAMTSEESDLEEFMND